jgi:hypothetical protein
MDFGIEFSPDDKQTGHSGWKAGLRTTPKQDHADLSPRILVAKDDVAIRQINAKGRFAPATGQTCPQNR